MSLSTRITLLVILVLSLGLGSGGLLLNRTVREAQLKKIGARLNARQVWMESALDVEYDQGKVELEAHGTPRSMAVYWSVSTVDGRRLWASDNPSEDEPVMQRSRKMIFGEDSWPLLPGAALQESRDDEEVGEAWRQTREQERTPIIYRFTPSKTRIELILSCASSTKEMQKELHHFRNCLIFGIPGAVLALGVVLTLLVRWQLGPLARMAEESKRIGPDNLSQLIGEAGTSAECIYLRASLNAMIGRLAEGIARERRFSQAAAHDLRTPLAQLRTQAEISLRHPRTPEEYRQALAEMVEDIARLEQMITGLLLLTRTDSLPAAWKQTVSLTPIIRDFEWNSPPDLELADPLWVVGDENMIRSAVQNVLDNARQYAAEPTPEITIEEDGEFIRLQIADHGPGVPVADRERIFDPLVRLDAARTPDEKAGFGLGLAIARNTLRAFGGDIVCGQRAAGAAGAVFKLSFRKSPGN